MELLEGIKKFSDAYQVQEDYIKSRNLSTIRPELNTKCGERSVKTLYDSLDNAQFIRSESYLELSPDDVYLFATTSLDNILGSSIDKSEYSNIRKMLLKTSGNDPYSASYTEDFNTKEKFLLFERLDTLNSVSTLAHESTHYIQDKYIKLKTLYHNEILPMLVEMIVAHEMTHEITDPNLFKNLMTARLESLQNIIREEYFAEISMLCMQGEDLEHLATLAHEYAERTAYMYVVSFTYAYNLFMRYREDKKTLLKKVQEIFTDNQELDKLLNYYNVSFSTPKILNAPLDAIKKYQKK